MTLLLTTLVSLTILMIFNTGDITCNYFAYNNLSYDDNTHDT
jgi:hypothetical protein